MCIACIDHDRAEAFVQRMLGVFNEASLGLMISVGHRTGLFDTMAKLAPATTDEIAAASGLQERYVREWLGAMVTGRIVTVDPATKKYTLPPEHAAFLTRAAAPDNLAVPTQFVAVLGGVEDDIVACFKEGGGVPYERFGRFHAVMAEESAQTVVEGLEDHILPLVPGIVARLEAGIDVLDVGCGSGRALNWLGARFPESRFLGYDFSDEAIERARTETRERELANVRFETRDVAELERDPAGAFDLVTAFDAIHDQARPDAVLRGIRRVLREDGRFLMQDIKGATEHHDNLDHPIAPFLYTISCMHCMTVSLAAGGMGLGAMWGREKAEEMLADAGFGRLAVHELPHDIMNYWYVARPA